MIIQILKRIKILLVLFPAVFLLLYCEDTEQLIRKRAQSQREKEISVLRTIGSDSYYGVYKSSDYDGVDCEDLETDNKDYEKCTQICKKIYNKRSNACEELPVKLIFKFDSLFTKMVRIRDGDNQLTRAINDFDFGVMIDIDVTPALLLIRDWSEREVTEFLIWTAETSSIALALQYHDKEDKILQAAFKKLGKDYGSGNARIEYGISKDLKSYGQTFWALAQKAKNQGAFIVMHRLVKSICSIKNCKLRLYCIREEFTNRSLSRQQCHYSSTRRSFSRSNHCYIQGPDVWSYWEFLNNEGEFDDGDFAKNTRINEEECNNLCQNENCKRQ